MPRKPKKVIANIESDIEQYQNEAEQILRSIVSDGDIQATYAQRQALALAGIKSDRDYHDEFRRMSNVIRNERIAGTAEQRAKLAAHAEECKRIFEQEAPKLEAEIDRLQKLLNGYERDARQASKRVEECAAAVGQLRQLVPKWIEEQINYSRTLLGQTLGVELGELRTRKNQLEVLLGCEELTIDSPVGYYCQSELQPDHPCYPSIKPGRHWRSVDQLAWSRHREELQSELDALIPKLEAMEETWNKEIEAIESERDFYISGEFR